MKEFGQSEVSIEIVNNSKESYTPPKPKFNFATSQGQSLSSSSSSSSSSLFSTAQANKIEPSADEPMTNLQIVLHDKKKIKETVPLSTTIHQLYEHIMHLSGISGFELLAGFPPKPLTNPHATIKEAGLLNATVTQRK
jgi:hypothetical protein